MKQMSTFTAVDREGKIIGEYEIVDKKARTDIGNLSEQIDDHKKDENVHVTDEEKQTWNRKSDFSGSYNDLTDKPSIPEKTDLTGYAKTEDIPKTLPNPKPLIFTGAATGSYDGSAPLTVNIPEGGGDTGGGGSAEWELLSEFDVGTTYETLVRVRLSTFGKTDFFFVADAKKTGVQSQNFTVSAGGTSTGHNCEIKDRDATVFGRVCLCDGQVSGYAGHNTGWANGEDISAITPSPRSTNGYDQLSFSYYPFQDTEVKAHVKLYGR